jgi:putative hydrolase of the HAD superfamily
VLTEVRAICFDLDNTLWHVDPVIARAEARLQAWLRERYPRIAQRWDTEAMRAHRMALAAAEPGRAHDLGWVRTESMARLAREAGYPPSMATEAFEAFHAWRCEVEPFPDVEPGLRALAAHYPLASLSNGNADLARIGLAGHFSVSLSAGDLGVAKPAQRAFVAVADALGCAPRELLYVGDDPAVDVAGARAAGLYTAWMNRFGRDWPSGHAPADLVASDLQGLLRGVRPDGAATP